MTRAYVAVGSNVDAERNLPRGLDLLARTVRVTGVSTFYATRPVGPAGQPAFVNGALAIDTAIAPDVLKWVVLRDVERELGRRRGPDKYAPRPIDLDLVLYGGLVLRNDRITLPDPDVTRRPFVAVPIAELDPGLSVPGTGDTVGAIASRLPRDGLEPLPHLTLDLRARLLAHPPTPQETR